MPADCEDPTDQDLEQAVDWFHRLADCPDDAGLRRAFRAWLAESPAHARAWHLTRRSWHLASAGAGVTARPGIVRRATRAAAGIAGLALAACLAVFLILPQLRLHLTADRMTAAGESETLTLEDGSQVDLAPGSAVRFRFSTDRRGIDLLSGEAFFQVRKDAARPFTVVAGGVSVTVTGTAFDVGLSDRTVAVAVAHGSVRVGAPGADEVALAPGDRLAFDRRDGGVMRTRQDAADVAAWRGGTLVVHGQPLADVVDTIRRHAPGAVVVAMSGLDNRRVTGVFDLTRPARALRALAGPFGGVVRQVGPYLITVTGF